MINMYRSLCVITRLNSRVNKYKEKLVILQSIEILVKKVENQGWSPTPADSLVDILIPN